jgi:ATP-dependent RNA helicase DDX23/PRP28
VSRPNEVQTASRQELPPSAESKKRVIKPSEKFRFSFGWENTEDTSRDMNTLYQSPHEARLLFGRGFLAGIDRREQKKAAVAHEKETRLELRRKAGEDYRPEDDAVDRKKAAAADMYDAFDMRMTGTGLKRRLRR